MFVKSGWFCNKSLAHMFCLCRTCEKHTEHMDQLDSELEQQMQRMETRIRKEVGQITYRQCATTGSVLIRKPCMSNSSVLVDFLVRLLLVDFILFLPDAQVILYEIPLIANSSHRLKYCLRD